MRIFFISVFLIIKSSFAMAEFSLTCDNFDAIQFNLGDRLTLNSNAALDTYNTKYVFKNGYLYSRYPASSDDNAERRAKLVKSGFHNLKSNQEYYEFATLSSRYYESYVFHKNNYSWTAYYTHGGNNEGKLFQRTYWYSCKSVF